MQKSKPILYIDPSGKEHDALVFALNGLHEGFISVVYIDDKAPEADNLKKVFDIPHFSHASKQETRTVPVSDAQRTAMGEVVQEGNPDLPSYQVQCWKEYEEEHKALPADHPQFDHPFMANKFEEDGVTPIRPSRPEYEADLKAHQADHLDAGSLPPGIGSQPANEPAPPMHPEPDVATLLDEEAPPAEEGEEQ